MLKNLKFKTKIFFLVTAVVIVSFITINVVVYVRNIRIVKNDSYTLANEITGKYRNEIKAELQSAREAAEILSLASETMMYHHMSDRIIIDNTIKKILEKRENITTLCVFYEDDTLNNKNDGHEALYEFHSEATYNLLKATKQEYISDPYLAMANDAMYMMVSFNFPIIYNDEIIGMVTSHIFLDKIQEIVSRVNGSGVHEEAMIINNSGLVIAHPDKDYLGKYLAELHDHDILKATAAIRNGETFISVCKDYYTVFMPVQLSPVSSPWSVAVSIPLPEVQKTAKDIRNFIIVASVISIFVIALLLFIIAESIVRPIRNLAETAKLIGDGNYNTEIPVSEGDDEISVLSTAFKVMTEKLIAAKEQAEQSSMAKSVFLSNMSHEMRTPLNAIIGMTSIGKRSLTTEKKDYAFGKIEDASNHLLGVINDVLDMSKIEANKMDLSPVEFDFEKILQKAVNVINFRVDKKKQKLNVIIDKNIPKKLYGDDLRLSQVLTNLLSNAVKFTPSGGFIKIQAGLVSEENGVCEIKFIVSDSGIGISSELQDRLFNSFQQADSGTSRKFGGTGLGLAISKRIVELMGGKIHIESESGKGASFIFTVMLMRSDLAEKSQLSPDVDWSSIRALVVDDENDILEHFADMAKELGIACDTASNGEEAAALLEQNKWYDIYFVDWKMPGINGIDLAKIIKAQGSGKRVVTMISLTDWSLIADEAKAAGVDHFLQKPIFLSDVIDCIGKYFGSSSEKRQENEVNYSFPGRRILLAEDVEINREIVQTLLEPTELEIESAGNGSEALRLYSENPGKFDLILMDVQMPEMDGLEATRRIRSFEAENNTGEVPIIAMTANVFREDVDKCLEAGMDDHIGKPLEMDVILEKLKCYLSA